MNTAYYTLILYCMFMFCIIIIIACNHLCHAAACSHSTLQAVATITACVYTMYSSNSSSAFLSSLNATAEYSEKKERESRRREKEAPLQG